MLDNNVNDTLLNEETFRPIATFLPYDSEEKLLALMNNTPYSLSASLWTNDLSKALLMVPAIEASTMLDPAEPFGGKNPRG